MNREIKFRAWDGSKMIPFINILILDEMKAYPHGRKYIHDCTEWECNDLISKPILMQYTGLKDTNGKEIYESDIVKVRDHYNMCWSINGAEVIFSTEYVGGWVISKDGNNLNLGTRQKHIEVIGNIYENPELLQP